MKRIAGSGYLYYSCFVDDTEHKMLRVERWDFHWLEVLRLLGRVPEPVNVQSILCGSIDTRDDRDAKIVAGKNTSKVTLHREFIAIVEKTLQVKESDDRMRRQISQHVGDPE